MPGYLEDLNRARMAILSDRAGIDPPQIAQIGRERAENGPAGFWRGEGLKSPPWPACTRSISVLRSWAGYRTHLMDSNYQTDQQCLDAIYKALVEFPGPFLDFARDCDVTDDPAGDFVSDTQSLAKVHGDKWHKVAASRLYMADDVVRSAAGVIALKFFAHRDATR